jgi:hypothetical protein
MDAEQRAFVIIRLFFDMADDAWQNDEQLPEQLAAQFREWLADPRNAEAKLRALDRLIEMGEREMEGYMKKE